MSSETIRTFIAVPFSPPIQESLANISQSFKENDLDVKWVKAANFHMTMRFLGNLKPKRFKDVLDAFPSFLPATPSFSVTINHLGAFPRIQKPRVIWAGIQSGGEQLTHIANDVETALCRLGFPKADKPFSGHITLGRVRSPRNLPVLSSLIESYQWAEDLTQNICEVVLYRSTLTPQGPIYDRQAVIELD